MRAQSDGALAVHGGTADSAEFRWGAWEGRRVRALVSHLPVNPPGGRWGLGGCYWTPTGACPYGHREDPERMLFWEARGLVSLDSGGYRVGTVPVPPTGVLEGHECRVAVCLEPEELKTMDVHGAAEFLRANLDWLAAIQNRAPR